jgi:hypothetical protein
MLLPNGYRQVVSPQLEMEKAFIRQDNGANQESLRTERSEMVE